MPNLVIYKAPQPFQPWEHEVFLNIFCSRYFDKEAGPGQDNIATASQLGDPTLPGILRAKACEAAVFAHCALDALRIYHPGFLMPDIDPEQIPQATHSEAEAAVGSALQQALSSILGGHEKQ